jgi:hypothetical protein
LSTAAGRASLRHAGSASQAPSSRDPSL